MVKKLCIFIGMFLFLCMSFQPLQAQSTSEMYQLIERRERLLSTQSVQTPKFHEPDGVAKFVLPDEVVNMAKEAYDAGLAYRQMSIDSLKYAKEFLDKGNIDLANKYINDSDRLDKLSHSQIEASSRLVIGAMDMAGYKVMYEASGTAISTLTGPYGRAVVAGIKLGVEYDVDRILEGTDKAKAELVKKIFIEIATDAIGAGKIAQKGFGGSRIYPALKGLIGSSEFKEEVLKSFMRLGGTATGYAADEVVGFILSMGLDEVEKAAKGTPPQQILEKSEDIYTYTNFSVQNDIQEFQKLFQPIAEPFAQFTKHPSDDITNDKKLTLYGYPVRLYDDLYYPSSNDSNTYIFKRDIGKIYGFSDGDFNVQNAAAYSKAADSIVFSSNRDGNYKIYVMDTDGTNQTRLTNNTVNDYGPSWSSDGTKISFTAERDGNTEIYVMNSDGTNQTRLTNNSAADYQPHWSPDGTKIVFVSERDGNQEIYLINADGTNQTRLTNNSAKDGGGPSYSPDGTKIVFTSWRNGTSDIYTMSTDGTNIVRLTYGLWVSDVYYSPDGQKIIFSHSGAIYKMNADGSNRTAILTVSGSISPYAGSWSPDGTKIIIYSDRFDGNYEIYTINSDGTNRTRLTNNSASDMYPSWSSVSVTPNNNETWKGFANGIYYNPSNSTFDTLYNTSSNDVYVTFNTSDGKVTGQVSVANEDSSITALFTFNDYLFVSKDAFGGACYDACGGRGQVFGTNDNSSNYDYMSWGKWAAELGTPDEKRIFGFGSHWIVGRLTPYADIPTTGTATYTGDVMGSLINNGTGLFTGINGTTSLTANFANKTLTGTFDNLNKSDGSAWVNQANVNANWGGTNAISGTIAGGGKNGVINGAFFGPSAQEIGGNWTLNGGGDNAAGIFTGKK